MAEEQPEIFELDIDILEANPLQPRGLIIPESLSELADSIREHGILEPLVVAQTPAGYQIIAGERRWRAAKMAGLTRVPVVMKTTTPQGMLEMSIVENVQREDLNPIERAQAYKRLIEEFYMTTTEVARRVGKSLPYISNTVRLLTLPDALKDALISAATTEGHVRAILALEDPKLMLEVFKMVLREGASVRRTEDLVRKVRSDLPPKGPIHRLAKIHSRELEEMENKLSEKLGAGVKISQTGIAAKIFIIIRGDSVATTEKLKKIYSAIVDSLNHTNPGNGPVHEQGLANNRPVA